MTTPSAQDVTIRGQFHKPFNEQVAFWRQKLGNLVSTQRWDDMLRQAHDTGFMVAGAAKADLLADFAAAVDHAIAEGGTLDDFRRDFDDIVGRHGWEYNGGRNWRTRVIYTTNMRTSYAAGRLAQLREDGFRYWMYRHGGSAEPRQHHLALDGLVLPADDPFWETAYPPNGWGCSCYVIGVDELDDAVALGGDPEKSLPADWKSQVPDEWAYMPGWSVSGSVAALAQKLPELPAEIAAALGAQNAKRLQAAYRPWVDSVLGSQPQGRSAVVGVLLKDDIAWLTSHATQPVRADISISDSLIAGRKAQRHEQAGDALSAEEWRNFAVAVASAEALLYDRVKDNVLLVMSSAELDDSRKVKAVVEINYRDKRTKDMLNSVRSAFKVGVGALLDRTRYTVIRGEIKE